MPAGPETSGFNHVATMTADLDRYLAFHHDIFGAEVLAVTEVHDDHPRMAVVNMGGASRAECVRGSGRGNCRRSWKKGGSRSDRSLRPGGGFRGAPRRAQRAAGRRRGIAGRDHPTRAVAVLGVLQGPRRGGTRSRVPQASRGARAPDRAGRCGTTVGCARVVSDLQETILCDMLNGAERSAHAADHGHCESE